MFLLCICTVFYSLFSFLVMFYSYYIDVQLSHLNKDYLLTYLLVQDLLYMTTLTSSK